MQTLIQPEVKVKIASFEHSTCQVKDKSNFDFNIKFYQKFLVLFFSLCTFLIFPESPQDLEILCKKYHPKEACIVW